MASTALDLPLCKMSKLDKRSLWEILSVEKFDLRDGENGEERERDLKCVSVELTNSNKNLAIFLAGAAVDGDNGLALLLLFSLLHSWNGPE